MMRTLLVCSLAAVASTADAGGVGTRVGNPGWSDYFTVGAGPRPGTTLLAGCTTRTYVSAREPTTMRGPAAGLVQAVMASDGTWDRWSDTDEPDCAAIAAAAPDGDVLVGGETGDHLALGADRLDHAAGGSYAFLARLDGTGARARWTLTTTAKNPMWAQVTELAIAPNGDVAAAGWFMKDVDWGLGAMRARGYEDGFVIVVDGKTGKPKWQAPAREPGPRLVGGLGFARDGTLIVAASVATGRTSQKLSLTAYKPTGKVAWRAETRGDGRFTAHGLALAPSGDIVVTGGLHGVATIAKTTLRSDTTAGADARGDTDPVVLRFSPTGTLRWATLWHGGGEAHANAAAFVDDELWIVANYRGQIEVGSETIQATGNMSSLVARLDGRGRLDRFVPIRESMFVQSTRLFADGSDLVIAGDLLDTVALPDGTSVLDSDAFTIRWNRQGKLPRLATLRPPTLPRAGGATSAITQTPPPASDAYGGASYGGA